MWIQEILIAKTNENGYEMAMTNYYERLRCMFMALYGQIFSYLGP